jgi:hypothetical protein
LSFLHKLKKVLLHRAGLKLGQELLFPIFALFGLAGITSSGQRSLAFCGAMQPNPAVERDSQKLRFWFPTLRSGRPSLLR